MSSLDFGEILEIALGIGLQFLVLVIAFLIVNPLGKKLISKLLHTSTEKQNVSEARVLTLEKLLLNIYSYLLIFVFILMIFGVFNLEIGPLIASAGVVGLAIGFGAQGLVSDIVTGFFILLEKQLEVGEYITAAGYDGIVEEVGLRTTKIRSFDGTLNFIPNRQLEGISNHSRGTMRALVDIGISYDDNIDHAIRVLQDVCNRFSEDERFIETPQVLGVQQLGSSDVVIRVIGQTQNMEQWSAERDMRKAIKEAFDQNGIEIPFPQQVTTIKQEENA
ncbi:small conductance mechanosensitive channel [Streptohalobacillus salinus]|uniref:Small conductance mechanosensitive channel n=1 Tax=Streptohalobacillus salinus TaxID=621096 RepID=A0A2V3WD27_9BACI|nr:mechanosensitive ion channel family protein [Streptohalobacillus salinus]PXW92646.1 small conductance mechanosensitive channel [Streptohalobacillus salinus]